MKNSKTGGKKRELGRMYKMYDADGDGKFDKEEFVHMLNEIGVPEYDQEGVFQALDDGDGVIEFHEFLKWWKRFDVRQIFEQYDEDGSGVLDFTELFNLVEMLGIQLTKTEITHALSELDVDNSGTLSLEEFEPWWRQVLSGRLVDAGAKKAKKGSQSKVSKAKSLMMRLGVDPSHMSSHRGWAIGNIKRGKSITHRKTQAQKAAHDQGGTVIVEERVGDRWEDDLFLNHIKQEKEKQQMYNQPFRYELADDPSGGGYTVHHRSGTLFVREDTVVKTYFSGVKALRKAQEKESYEKEQQEKVQKQANAHENAPTEQPMKSGAPPSPTAEGSGPEKVADTEDKAVSNDISTLRISEQIKALESVLLINDPSLQYRAARALKQYVANPVHFQSTETHLSGSDRKMLRKQAKGALSHASDSIQKKLEAVPYSTKKQKDSLLLTVEVHLHDAEALKEQVEAKKDHGSGAERRSSVLLS